MKSEYDMIMKLSGKFYNGLSSRLDDFFINGHPEKRIPGNLNICFRNADSGTLMMSMKDIAISSGSACSSAAVEPSHVLKAIGLNDSEVRSSVRFGFGRYSTEEEIDYAVEKVAESVKRVRGIFNQVLKH